MMPAAHSPQPIFRMVSRTWSGVTGTYFTSRPSAEPSSRATAAATSAMSRTSMKPSRPSPMPWNIMP